MAKIARTIALVTHDPEIAAVTPRRIEIRDGKIAAAPDPRLAGTGSTRFAALRNQAASEATPP